MANRKIAGYELVNMLNPMFIPMAIHLFFPGALYIDDHALLTMASSELPKTQTLEQNSGTPEA